MKIPPIIVNSSNTPNDLSCYLISADKLPNVYSRDKSDDVAKYVSVGDWTYRKEAKIRDKWVKVRVRYSGKNLAVIHSVITLFNISYA
jgi:hypothetical protein